MSKGIRISDSSNYAVCVDLNDILKELYQGATYYWSIQAIEINGYKGANDSVMNIEKEARASEFGRPISWGDLCALGNDVFQFIELILIASKKPENNIRLQERKKKYEISDIYIEMFDSSYWEVFSKDHTFIDRLSKKFKEIEFLEPDFLEKDKS